MKIVVIGGTGLVGRQLVGDLAGRGHKVVAASPSSRVDSITGEGLAQAFAGAQIVVDVSNAASLAEDEVLAFFGTSATNIAAAARKAGVKHVVVLSIVGTDRLQTSGYFRGKQAQESAVAQSGVPYTIVRATQFFEFLSTIADGYTRDGVAHLPIFAVQPVAAADVAAALADVALSEPVNDVTEIAGPERASVVDFVGTWLGHRDDPRAIVSDEDAGYFGAPADDRTLVPGDGARLLPTRFEAWLAAQPAQEQA
ncbi:SDR family oxidoreductase [Sphingomonas jeddahensis]|uniref:NmrA-like family protein n=1 Tax=Sphingomonas jeddahensis TaxID=1915074 RepID=A0A1V2EW62_9SPHN|nr:SDR family oxidoreductase [Sphingomonas jeddahensis]ONF96840.1 NmrA-like family protein [Sphingomonas jeddahensis]